MNLMKLNTAQFGLLAFALVAGMVSPVAAQDENSANAAVDASVRVVQPITLINIEPLNFGKVFAPLSGGSGQIVVTASAVQDPANSFNIQFFDFSTVQAAEFSVEGEPDQFFSVGLPAGGRVELNGPSGTLTAVFLTAVDPVQTTQNRGKLVAGADPAVGEATLLVGASLSVPVGTDRGVYSGQFDISVTYE